MTKLISCFCTSLGQIFRLSEMLFSMKSVRDPDQVVSGHLSRQLEEENISGMLVWISLEIVWCPVITIYQNLNFVFFKQLGFICQSFSCKILTVWSSLSRICTFWDTILFASLVSKYIDKEAAIIDLFRITGNGGFQHTWFFIYLLFFLRESMHTSRCGFGGRGRKNLKQASTLSVELDSGFDLMTLR